MALDQLRGRLNGRSTRARLVTGPFVLAIAATLAYFVSVGALIPTLPRYVKTVLGGGDVAVGLTIGSFALAAVCMRPWIGRLGDIYGRKVLIIAGATLVAVAVASYTATQSLVPLLLMRLVSGAGEAAFYVGVASVINDLAPDERRGEAISYFSLGLYAGLAVGPVLGESVLHAAGYPVTWLVAAASAGIAALLGLRVPDTRPEGLATSERSSRIIQPAALLPGAVLATAILGLSGFNTFVPLYALDLGLNGSRTVFLLFSVIVLGVRSLGARIPDRIGHVRCARYALATSSMGLAVIALWNTPAGLFVGTGIVAVGQSLTFPALMTIAIGRAPVSERAAVVGTFTAFFDLSFGLGSVSLGAVASVLGYPGAFATAAVMAAVGLAVLFLKLPMRAEPPTTTSPPLEG